MEGISGFVLAGGQSSRMGADKAFIELDGCTMLERAIKTAHTVADEVTIVGERAKYGAFGEVVEDAFARRGPLGGIHAALVSSGTERNLILGVDLPFLDGRFPKFLVAAAFGTERMVTVPFANGRFEPLCAVYRKSFAGIAEKALASGKNSVHELFSRAVARVVSEKEIVESGFGLEMFWNVNTRDDLARLQAKSKLETKAEDFNRKGRSERF